MPASSKHAGARRATLAVEQVGSASSVEASLGSSPLAAILYERPRDGIPRRALDSTYSREAVKAKASASKQVHPSLGLCVFFLS